MDVAGPILAIIALGALIGLLIQAGFILWGARIAGIEGRTFGKAIGTTILGGFASCIVSVMLGGLLVTGIVSGFIGGLLISVLVMMPIFRTSFGKALGATVLAWVMSLLVMGGLALAALLLVGGLAALP